MIFSNGETKKLNWLSGKYKLIMTVERKGERLWLTYPYNKQVIVDIKDSFHGYKWHGYEDPPIKKWSVSYSQHNLFQMEFFSGGNPYARYDEPLRMIVPSRKEIREHQIEIASQILHRRYSLIAAEMGTGKTLAAIEAMEIAGFDDWLWVGPRSALYSVQLEFIKWKAKVHPIFVTYSGLQKYLKEWPVGRLVHRGVIFDEKSKCKNVTSQRTQAAQYLADSIRDEWGENGIVAGLTGSPAPKSPADWYSQCEIACPGYIKEGDIHRFKRRLAIIKDEENQTTGGAFPRLVGWRDNKDKCNICGEMVTHEAHDPRFIALGTGHNWVPSINEVAYFYERAKGLVLVKLKKECTDLPDKIFRIIQCKPDQDTLRAAKMIVARTSGAAKSLILLRELSDGFQYTETPDGEEICPCCKGTKTTPQLKYTGPKMEDWRSPGEIYPLVDFPEYWESLIGPCTNCDGLGVITKYIRTVAEIKCPKDQVLIDLLEEHEDVGRLVVYAGFTGSIDRCANIIKDQEWQVIRVDGRGWATTIPDVTDPTEMLDIFQNQKDKRIVFLGHPGSAGMGLTLTASPSIFYFSNDFNGESRIQSMDRIHRLGMDENRGATIIDVFNLPTDKYVLDNLNLKRDLQSMSMGELNKALTEGTGDGTEY